MQMVINVPDRFSPKAARRRIREIEIELEKEAKLIEIEARKEPQETGNDEAWSEFLDNIDEYAIETGVTDLAKNHDYYLYGVPKRS